MSTKVKIVRHVKCGSELVNQLVIRGGKLVTKDNGDEPIFDIPDGAEVNVVLHADLVRCVDDAMLLRGIGA